jgi:protein-S-isoprenylcysteine O-methyltransferase Ste14
MNGSNAVACTAVENNNDSFLVRFLLRHRMQISLIVFVGLIAEDFLMGIVPHGVLDAFNWHSITGLASIALGLALRSWAAGTLHKWQQLTTTGPYRLIRNPLYVGSFLMMIGFCLLIGDPKNIWFVVGPMFGLYWLKVRREERTLAEKFGDAWTEYTSRTPRMLPRRWPTFAAGEWRFSQWLKNCEYNAIAGSLAGLVAIELWHAGIFHA